MAAATLFSVLVACGQAASAADRCRPTGLEPAQTTLTLERANQYLGPRLEAVLARDLALPSADPAAFGLTNAATAATLDRPVTLPATTIGYGALVGDQARLTFADPGASEFVATVGAGTKDEKRYAIRTLAGQPVSTDAQALLTAPLLFQPQRLAAIEKAQVRRQGSGVVIAAGSRLRWSLDTADALPVVLLRDARLEQTTQAVAGVGIADVRPLRTQRGTLIHVKLNSPGFDFKTGSLAFCFAPAEAASSASPADEAITVVGKLISESNDGAEFEVAVPTNVAVTKISNANTLDSVKHLFFSTPARLRVLGYTGDRLVLDTAGSISLSGAFSSVVFGLLVLGALAIFTAVFSGTRNPLRIASELLRHSSGRYSLGNFQVMLWTLLVIFALSYTWASTGDLLVISSGMLVLLGISGTTSVLSRTVDKPADDSAVKASPKSSDLFMAEDGSHFDLLRFQMLGFTLFAWFYCLASLLQNEGLPDIPQNLYLLMGVSNAAYLGGKLPGVLQDGGAPASADVPSDDRSTDERALSDTTIKSLQASLGAQPTGRIDQATRAAVQQYKLQHNLLPVNGTVSQLLIDYVAAQPSTR